MGLLYSFCTVQASDSINAAFAVICIMCICVYFIGKKCSHLLHLKLWFFACICEKIVLPLHRIWKNKQLLPLILNQPYYENKNVHIYVASAGNAPAFVHGEACIFCTAPFSLSFRALRHVCQNAQLRKRLSGVFFLHISKIYCIFAAKLMKRWYSILTARSI